MGVAFHLVLVLLLVIVIEKTPVDASLCEARGQAPRGVFPQTKTQTRAP